MEPTTPIDGVLSFERVEIKKVGDRLKRYKEDVLTIPFSVGVDKDEMIANVTLAYRHLEDAAMRLGKAIQAYEGGKGIYDNNDAKRVAANGPVTAGHYSDLQA